MTCFTDDFRRMLQQSIKVSNLNNNKTGIFAIRSSHLGGGGGALLSREELCYFGGLEWKNITDFSPLCEKWGATSYQISRSSKWVTRTYLNKEVIKYARWTQERWSRDNYPPDVSFIFRVFCVIFLPRYDKDGGKLWGRCFELITIFRDTFILIYLASFWNRILFCRPTLWWGEMNLIGQIFLVGSPGGDFLRDRFLFMRF